MLVFVEGGSTWRKTLWTAIKVLTKNKLNLHIKVSGLRRGLNLGRFPFAEKFRKLGCTCKWNMTFRFVPLEIFRNKQNFRKGSPIFPVETSQWKFVLHSQISCLYHQFHTFRGLLSGQASLGSFKWNLWQMEHALPKRKFQMEVFQNFCKWKMLLLHNGGRWVFCHCTIPVPSLLFFTLESPWDANLNCLLILSDTCIYSFLLVLVQCREGNFPGDSKKITYKELLQEVCKFANVLKGKGKKTAFFFG